MSTAVTATKFHWYLPIPGDSRALFDVSGSQRQPDIGYLKELALAAERNRVESQLTPAGRNCPDAWIASAALTQVTSRIKFLVAFRPGLLHPNLDAQMAETYQNISGNRLSLNIVTGADDAEQRSYGGFTAKAARYARTEKFLDILRREWQGQPYRRNGEYYQIDGLGRPTPLSHRPTIFFGGASADAERVSSKHADVHLFFGETPPMLKERIDRLTSLAAKEGRQIKFGIRLHVINRSTSDLAWAKACQLLDELPGEVIRRAQERLNSGGAVGHQRNASEHVGTKRSRDALQIHPNIWTGSSLIYGNPALVGSDQEVADRIKDYMDLGIEHFVFSGYPRLESRYEFVKGVLPLFKKH